MKEHTCNTYIVKSNLRSKESRVIQSNQDVHVYGCMVDIYVVASLILLYSLKTYLSFFPQVGIGVPIVLNISDTYLFFLNSPFFSSFL
jgi:hypothetical protein